MVFASGLFDETVDKPQFNGYTEVETLIKALMQFENNYCIEWR